MSNPLHTLAGVFTSLWRRIQCILLSLLSELKVKWNWLTKNKKWLLNGTSRLFMATICFSVKDSNNQKQYSLSKYFQLTGLIDHIWCMKHFARQFCRQFNHKFSLWFGTELFSNQVFPSMYLPRRRTLILFYSLTKWMIRLKIDFIITRLTFYR